MVSGIESGEVRFYFTAERFALNKRTELKRFLFELAENEGSQVESLSYIFCSDEELLEINQTHLSHNTYTDIITFPFSPVGEPIVSDIYISAERVRENAKTFNTTFKQELHRVIFHGVLHLCGYKDKSKKDQKLMREKEDQYLQLYFRST